MGNLELCLFSLSKERLKFVQVTLGENLCRDKITGAKEVAQSHVRANSWKLKRLSRT